MVWPPSNSLASIIICSCPMLMEMNRFVLQKSLKERVKPWHCSRSVLEYLELKRLSSESRDCFSLAVPKIGGMFESRSCH